MVIMERPTHHLPVDREIFQKQLDVAVAQFGLVYPCLLKDRTVDLYKLYCLVWEIKLKTNGDYSYTDNVEEWRRIAEEMGYMGDINAIVLFKIYNRYIAEGYEKSSSNLSGVPFSKSISFNPKMRQQLDRASSPRDGASTPGSDGEMPRQKRVYRKRKEKDRSVLSLPPSIARSITPVRLNPARYNMAPIRYNIHSNKSFSTCTRPGSPKVGGSRGRGASPARGSRGASPARGSRGATPPVVVRTVDICDKTAQLRGGGSERPTVSGVPQLATRDTVQQEQVPQGCVVEGKGPDSYIVDDGILHKPTGEPEKYDVNPIIRQLECGLPHEVQFGLNMVLWMTKSWALPLPKYPRLLPALIANVGILHKPTAQFWEDDGMRDFWEESQQDSHFFNTGLQAQRTRAIQISVIFGNLCHIESNAKLLLKSDSFLHYLIQSLSSSCIPIRNSGVEILAILANQVELEHAAMFSSHVFQKLPLYLTSSDRFLVISGLEVITSLCSIANNHAHLIDNLTAELYQLICQLLLVPDVQLLHAVLESMYSLTSIGLHPCEQFQSRTRVLTTLVDLFSCTAETLEHRGIKVLRYVERKPSKCVSSEERNAAERADVKVTAAEIKIGSVTQHQLQKSVDEVKGPVAFAERWVKRNLQFSPGSILLKCAVYNKYVKAANVATQAEVVSPAELFTLLSNTFPGTFRQKISVGSTMKFVVKNMDWLRGLAQPTSISTSSDGPAYFMKIKSIAPKTDTSRPNTPITQFTTPKTPANETSSTKVKLNPLPLTDIADDAFKFVSEKKEDTGDEMRSSDEDCGRKKRRKKKKKVDDGVMIVAKIIVEELDQSDPKIIEECEDIDGRIVPEDNDFPISPQPARIVKTYSAKRRLSGESLYARPNNAFSRFNQQQPREYSQYKKTLMLDLSTTPEKKQRMEENAARANTPSFSKPTSPVFDAPNSPTYDRTFEKVVSPTFDKRNDSSKEGGPSPTFDRCASPVFNCSKPSSKKIKSCEDQPSSPTFDKPESPTFDKPESPTFNKPGSPTIEKQRSPTFDKPGSPTFDKPGSPTFDKPGSPTFEKQRSPTFDKTGSPAFDKPGSPTFEKQGSPTFDKPGSPAFDKPGSPTFEKQGSPTFDKPGSPTFDKPGSPAFDKPGSPTVDKPGSPTYEKQGSPTFEKQGSPTLDKTVANNEHQVMNQLGCKPSESVAAPTPRSSSEVVDHLNSMSGSMLDDPTCSFSPLPNFEPDTSIFDRNSENSTGKSDKLKIDNDIFVSEAEVDTYTRPLISPKKNIQTSISIMSSCSQILNNPGNQRKVLVSSVPDSRKTVLKTVVSNHQSGEQMSAVSLIPISISGHINSRTVPQISSDPTTPNSRHNTVRLAKISPQKSNTQYVNQGQQFQVLVPSQQQNVMVVNQQPGSSQQMYVMPGSASPQQRLIVSPPNSATQQVLVLPHNHHPNTQQILLAPQNQATAQQVFVSQPQQPSNISGQPIFIATSGHNSGQPIIIAQQNQTAPTGHQVLLSQTQTSAGHQFILAPQPGNTGQIILSPNQSTGPQPVFIAQQSATNGPVIVQTPNSQVPGQILIAPQGQVPQGQVIISPQSSTRVLVLPQSQQATNQVLIAPQQSSNNAVQQFVIGTQTSPPSHPPSSEQPSNQVLLSSAPVFINSTSNPVIISSQTGSPTKQILVPLSTSSFSAARISPASSNVTSRISPAGSNVTSLMTSVTTSCTTVYSEPVVCTAPSRYTYTLSPSKLPVMSPIKVTHISPIKFMTNGAGSTVALMSNNQQRVGGTGGMSPQITHKRPLTRIAPRPVATPSTANTISVPSPATTTTTTITVDSSVGSTAASYSSVGSTAASYSSVGSTSSYSATSSTPTVTVDRKRKLDLPPSRHPYPCHWRNCSGGFEREIELRNHLLSKHVTESPAACLWATCCESPGARSRYSLIFHLKNIHARAPLLTHIPSCSYTREKVRLLLSKTLPWTDPRETPITKSLHLLIALIIRNMVFYTPELVGDISRFEGVFAMIAMSSQEAGRVLTDVLALTSGITQDCDEGVFITHLPPFR